MGKDTTPSASCCRLDEGQRRASRRRSQGPGSREKLAELERPYQEFQGAVASILGNLQALVNAKQAGRRVVDDSEQLLAGRKSLPTPMSKARRAHDQLIVSRRALLLAIGISPCWCW